MANVASGRFDGYWQRELNYWDVAAGIIIIKKRQVDLLIFLKKIKITR